MRHGRPVAIVVSPTRMGARRMSDAIARAAAVRAALESARRSPLPSTGLSNERADELADYVRTARSKP